MIENKPIALVTGAPGSGKTALIVSFIKKAADEGRPIYQMGIPELKIPYIPMPPVEEWTEIREDPDNPGFKLPYFTFAQNALVVLSEAQRVFRPRPAASKLPDHVAAFETCRHTGVTFVLDTQHPDFIDSHIRKLIGQHVHLLDHGVLGRYHYEWPYLGSPEYFKQAPIKKRYRLPKEVFDLYKSSSLHIKRRYSIPPALVILLLSVVALIGGGWYAARSINKKMDDAQKPSALIKEGKGQIAGASPAVLDLSTVDPIEARTPKHANYPETAPLYAGMATPKDFPRIVGCIKTTKACRCYDQQGNEIFQTPDACEAKIANFGFDPYREPVHEAALAQSSGRPQNRLSGQEPPSAKAETGHPRPGAASEKSSDGDGRKV